VPSVSRIVPAFLVGGKHVRQFRLVHLVHQFLYLFRPHRHAAEHAELQRGTDENHTQPARNGHDTPSRVAATAPHTRIGLNRDLGLCESEDGWRGAAVEGGEKRDRLFVAPERLAADDGDNDCRQHEPEGNQNRAAEGGSKGRNERRADDQRDADDRDGLTVSKHGVSLLYFAAAPDAGLHSPSHVR
jgi:hypothetical protein